MSSILLCGLGVSPGIAIGEPVVRETRPVSTLRIAVPPEGITAEVERFQSAVAATLVRIRENRERVSQQMGEEYAAIFEAHELIASDPSLNDPVVELIRTSHINAEWALDQVVDKVAARFESLDDTYLSERRLDLRDVADQIMHALQGIDVGQLGELDRPVILVADDLPPSQAARLPLEKILGFALETGGPTSHTTIIARSLGIPVIVGTRGVCRAALKSRSLAMDAFEGKIVFDPDRAELSELRSRQREYEEQQAWFKSMRDLPTVTRDGRQLQLLANIDLPAEIDQAAHWNVDGVGLYRSEFLYMLMSPGLPTEEEHLESYRGLVRRVDNRPVTIRTFDLGGRKLAREVKDNTEANPVLGLRGIRLLLARPDLFKTQLRALLRLVGEHPPGTVRVLLPLISCLDEFRMARLLVRKVAEELREEGHQVPEEVPLGVMIEVPSAAIMATELAREVDFFSIGTNDLIQYSLAVDRSNELVAGLYRPTSPAVLRLIHQVIAAGMDAGIDVTMCGEMAAEPLMVPVLVGLGLRRFSMNPQAISAVRSLIRQLSFRESAQMAKQALRMATSREVEEFLLERLAILFAKTKIRI